MTAIEFLLGAPDEVVIIGSISEYRSATLKGVVPVPGLLVADNVGGLD